MPAGRAGAVASGAPGARPNRPPADRAADERPRRGRDLPGLYGRPGRGRGSRAASLSSSSSPLGGDRGALSCLRELHAGLPDLLLHERHPALGPRRPQVRRGTAMGLLLLRRFRESGGRQLPVAPPDRYRQWLTHKFSTWVDQFGSFGCVGCGRCITWCPVGIDVREELARDRPFATEPGEHAPDRGRDATRPPYRPGADRATTSPRDSRTRTTLRAVGRRPAHRLRAFPASSSWSPGPASTPVPISVSPLPPGGGRMELSIQAAVRRHVAERLRGGTSSASAAAGPGLAHRGCRGPDVVVVAGGSACPRCGRSSTRFSAGAPVRRVRLFHGARAPADRPYTRS